VFDLTGKIALVTGAGRGVGVGIGRQLVDAGATLVLNDLYADRVNATAERLAEPGATVVAMAFDVAHGPSVQAAIADIETELGPVDILVNNAGVPVSSRPVQFLEMMPEEWASYIDLNLYGVLNCVRAVLPGMYERHWGRVITISSDAGRTGVALGVSIYGAGKGGAISFIRHLALESAAHGVTANSLALGIMSQAERQTTRSVTAGLERQIPVGRLGTGDDVGYACVYLASEEASWMTGQTISLNGGLVTI
jgi:NAD(P)-dependent dehydrogenase (short-subunit alcohol dehydrogenase family)